VIDTRNLTGTINFVGTQSARVDALEGERILEARAARDDLSPHPLLPDDTKLWAALQNASGGVWGGCVYDADLVTKALARGLNDHLKT
jgi:xylonate dehydratase